MNIWQHLMESLESLTANKLRSGLTILGIVIGVASVISMLAIGQGATASVNAQIQSIGSNLLFVSSSNGGQGGAAAIAAPKPLTLQDATALTDPTNAPDVAAAVGVLNARGTISVNGVSTSASVVGTTSQYATVRNLNLTEGQFITDTDVSGHSATVVLGSGIATTLFGQTTGLVGQEVRINNQPFRVVGVLQSVGGGALGSQDNQVIVPLTTAQIRLENRGGASTRIDQIIVQASSASGVAAAQEEVTNILRTQHNTRIGSDDFTILSQQDILNTATSVTGTLTLLLGGIGAISLVVGGIGIMNIMLVSVTERTREIGLRKALGAHKSDIRLQFMIESSVLSLLGGLVGVAVAAGVSKIIANIAAASSTAINPVIGLNSVLLACLFSAAVGLFFGIYPANRASNLEPVEALRFE
jgi:putative ABC transport system permease protein